jgi:cell division transport system permease protein
MSSTTWKYMRRSPFQAMAAIITMFLAFLLGGFFFLVTITSESVLHYFEGKPQITVFFTDKATDADAESLRAKLVQTGKTSKITYISKQQALTIYREQNKNDPLLLELVNADILPASLEVSATDPKYLKELEPQIRTAPNVEDVIYQKDIVDSFISWTNAIRLVGGILAVILIIDSLLIIFTVIAMKIAQRKEEVEILKLVGATPWYIRIPFILEGSLYGIFGAGAAALVIIALIIYSRTYILTFLGVVPQITQYLSNPASTPFLAAAGIFALSMIILGMIFGVIGSMLSVGRYLKF